MRLAIVLMLLYSSGLFAGDMCYYSREGAQQCLTPLNSAEKKALNIKAAAAYFGGSPVILTGELVYKPAKHYPKEKEAALLRSLTLTEAGRDDTLVFVSALQGNDIFKAARILYETGAAQWAQPVWLHKIKQNSVPNDPYFEKQWHLELSNAAAAWDITSGLNSVFVAVIDSGVEASHPDLTGRIVTGKGFTDSGGTNPEKGLSGSTVNAMAAHGTCVSGIIAATGNNTVGVTGVCPECRVIPVKFLDAGEQWIKASRIYNAIKWAADNGADVINMSWGDEDKDGTGKCIAVQKDELRAEAIQYAREKGRNGRGTLVVQAAGNSACDTALNENLKNENILLISAVTESGEKAYYSNTGLEVDLAAGAAAVTTDLTGPSGMNSAVSAKPQDQDYTYAFGGTSASAAVVSGAAALMFSSNPTLSYAEAMGCLKAAGVKTDASCTVGAWVLENTPSDPFAPAGKERSPCFGFGIIDFSLLAETARNGTCGSVYSGCTGDAQCGTGFTCNPENHQCEKEPPSSGSSGGCSLVF